MNPPGGTTGRVGYDTGWMRRPCRTRDPRSGDEPSIVIAGTYAAEIVAIGIELADPAAAAIAVIIVAVAGGDRTADHGGAEETRSEAPAEAPGFRLGGGGCDGAGHGERGESQSGNSGFDRHVETPSGLSAGAVSVRMLSWTERLRIRFESQPANFDLPYSDSDYRRLERFRAKWIPARVKNTRQNKN